MELIIKNYIGSTCSPLSHRLHRHCSDSMDGPNSSLYKHIRLIGQFEFKIILTEGFSCDTEFEIRYREQLWMDKQTINLKQSSRSKFKEIHKAYCFVAYSRIKYNYYKKFIVAIRVLIPMMVPPNMTYTRMS